MKHRTFKRKLKLSKIQEQRLLSWIGVCRLVHNMSIEIRRSSYAGSGKSVSKYELMRQVTELRKEIEWIRDVPADSLSRAVNRMDTAYQSYFKGKGFPKWANRRSYKSIYFRDIKIDNNFVIIPKIGRLRIFKDSEIVGIPKTATIKIEPTGFFICIQCDNVPKKFDSENQAIGLDMGISKFCVDSNGNFITNPKHFARHDKRLRIENRSLARKKRGSKGWIKQARKVSIVHHKIARVRRDFLHKESTAIAKANNVVFVEDLKIGNMVKNKNLSRHILDCGWGIFREMLEYKTTVFRVDPKQTSQTCNTCGNIDKESRMSQSEFKCLSCGHADNADINAAKNILSRGTAIVRQREALACALGE